MEQIIKRVDEILELNKQGITDINTILENEEIEKLCNLPKVLFSIKDDAKVEKIRVGDSRIYLNSDAFIEIKDNKVRDFVVVCLNSNSEKLYKSKNAKTIILNLPVPKSEEILKEIIKRGSVDNLEIKEKINKLE